MIAWGDGKHERDRKEKMERGEKKVRAHGI